MNGFPMRVATVAIGLAFGSGALAQTMSKTQYNAARDGIAAEYRTAKAACRSLSGNAKDICKAQAGGEEKVAKAELDAKYKPSVDASYKARVARADANYSVAREECDDKAGNIKDVCVKEAKAALVSAKADALAQKKTVNANNTASDAGADARKDAAVDKRDADYAVAKEKCEAFAGEMKNNCIGNAKARFGKS
jgi:hypothetical protein